MVVVATDDATVCSEISNDTKKKWKKSIKYNQICILTTNEENKYLNDAKESPPYVKWRKSYRTC